MDLGTYTIAGASSIYTQVNGIAARNRDVHRRQLDVLASV
jgi:hypothetical protein